jgi:hypothetical protein
VPELGEVGDNQQTGEQVTQRLGSLLARHVRHAGPEREGVLVALAAFALADIDLPLMVGDYERATAAALQRVGSGTVTGTEVEGLGGPERWRSVWPTAVGSR